MASGPYDKDHLKARRRQLARGRAPHTVGRLCLGLQVGGLFVRPWKRAPQSTTIGHVGPTNRKAKRQRMKQARRERLRTEKGSDVARES